MEITLSFDSSDFSIKPIRSELRDVAWWRGDNVDYVEVIWIWLWFRLTFFWRD